MLIQICMYRSLAFCFLLSPVCSFVCSCYTWSPTSSWQWTKDCQLFWKKMQCVYTWMLMGMRALGFTLTHTTNCVILGTMWWWVTRWSWALWMPASSCTCPAPMTSEIIQVARRYVRVREMPRLLMLPMILNLLKHCIYFLSCITALFSPLGQCAEFQHLLEDIIVPRAPGKHWGHFKGWKCDSIVSCRAGKVPHHGWVQKETKCLSPNYWTYHCHSCYF